MNMVSQTMRLSGCDAWSNVIKQRQRLEITSTRQKKQEPRRALMVLFEAVYQTNSFKLGGNAREVLKLRRRWMPLDVLDTLGISVTSTNKTTRLQLRFQ